MTEHSQVQLSMAAWAARENARIIGKTAVGCAVLDSDGEVHVGCNVEHQFRSHDIHAEVNALSSLIGHGGSTPVAVFIVAERAKFTPCGSCLDWIFELGGADCVVMSQNTRGGDVLRFTADELMPHYPN